MFCCGDVLVIKLGIDSQSTFIRALLSVMHFDANNLDDACDGMDDVDDIFKFIKFFSTTSSPVSLAELTLVSELTLDERPLLGIDLCGDNCFDEPFVDPSLCFRQRSDGPTFNADLRKSLFCHLVVDGSLDVAPFIDDVDDVRTVLVGDSDLGAGGGNVLLLNTLCFDGDMDGVRCDVSDELLELDFSPDNLSMDFDLERKDELLRDTDGDLDDELSRIFDGGSLYFIADTRSVERPVVLSLELFSFFALDEYESSADASL